VEREVRWLSELIDDERRRETPAHDVSDTNGTNTTNTPAPGHPGAATVRSASARRTTANNQKEHP
jgi:hypothetical protein